MLSKYTVSGGRSQGGGQCKGGGLVSARVPQTESQENGHWNLVQRIRCCEVIRKKMAQRVGAARGQRTIFHRERDGKRFRIVMKSLQFMYFLVLLKQKLNIQSVCNFSHTNRNNSNLVQFHTDFNKF